MKRFSVFIMIIFISITVFSQQINVTESKMKIAGDNNNALVVLIKETDKKQITKEWTSLMKTYKAKVSGKKEVFADDATMPLISNNTVDVYAIAEQVKNDVRLVVAFDLGGAFLNSKDHNPQFKAAETILYEFVVEISKQNVQSNLSAEKKKLSGLEKKQSNLKKSTDKMIRENEKMKKKIADNEKVIKDNQKEQESLDKEINDQKSTIQEIEKKFKSIK
jgi:hypothetical protein